MHIQAISEVSSVVVLSAPILIYMIDRQAGRSYRRRWKANLYLHMQLALVGYLVASLVFHIHLYLHVANSKLQKDCMRRSVILKSTQQSFRSYLKLLAPQTTTLVRLKQSALISIISMQLIPPIQQTYMKLIRTSQIKISTTLTGWPSVVSSIPTRISTICLLSYHKSKKKTPCSIIWTANKIKCRHVWENEIHAAALADSIWQENKIQCKENKYSAAIKAKSLSKYIINLANLAALKQA